MMPIVLSMMVPVLMQATYTSVEAELLPLVFIALLLDAAIIGAWYLFGSLLGNGRVKEGAKNEFVQLLGTAILAAIIVGFMATVGGTITGAFNSVPSLSTATVSSLCANIMGKTQLSVLGAATSSNTFSFLGGAYAQPLQAGQQPPAVFPGICSYVQHTDTLDQQIDYPLAATSVIIANLTNQTANNLNDAFVLNAYLNYLGALHATMALCLQAQVNEFGPCIIPLQAPANPAALMIEGSYQPYAGMTLPADTVGTVGTLLGTALEMFLAQLSIVSMFLYLWPFLLFIGLVLRATPFTRKIGGLFISVALAVVLIYPSVFALEYMTNGIGNGVSNVAGSTNAALDQLGLTQQSIGEVYGFNGILTSNMLAIDYSHISSPNTPPQTKTYTANFFVQPSVRLIAEDYQCWPTDPAGNTDMTLAIAADTGSLLIPYSSAVRLLLPLIQGGSSLMGSAPHLLIPYSCDSQDIEYIAFTMFNLYGLMVVTVVLLPIFNIMITLSGIIGLSGLFGGDTGLAGLSRLV